MKSTALKKEALTQTYFDVENLIYNIVWKFKNCYGGDFEELVAEANLLYIYAYNSHNKKTSKFSTWVYFCIWKGLIDFINFLKEKNKYGRVFLLEELECFQENFISSSETFVELIDEVGEDSKTIINLIMNLPKDLQNNILQRGGHPHNVRIPIRNYLSSKLGWTGKRIKESFDEIKKVIECSSL